MVVEVEEFLYGSHQSDEKKTWRDEESKWWDGERFD